jgi:hypothetical protein
LAADGTLAATLTANDGDDKPNSGSKDFIKNNLRNTRDTA